MCTYCGCQSISLIGRFMAEHEELVNLSGDLHRARDSGDLATIDEALTAVLAVLHPHAGAEESGLFTVLRRNPDFADHVDGLCSEHTTLDGLAERIRAGEHALIHDFTELLRDHMAREDNGLFPAAAIELDGPDWEEAIELSGPRLVEAGHLHTHPHGADELQPHEHSHEHAYPHEHAHPHAP